MTTRYAPMTTDSHAPDWAREESELAPALDTLRQQINGHWPTRDHGSDGTIGDAAHLAEGTGSDHCPWCEHTVRALDVDVDGIDAGWLAEGLRRTGLAGDHRLTGGGYVIYNRKITTPDFTGWTDYHGTDPHTSHVHVSVTRDPAGFRDGSPWTFLDATPAPTQQPAHPGPVRPTLPLTGHDATGRGESFRADLGDAGPEVRELQHDLNRYAPAYSHLAEDGVYGEATAAVVEEFAHRSGIADADGRNAGPRIAHALHLDGLI